MYRQACLVVFVLSFAVPAAAAKEVWQVYPADNGGTLVVIDQSEIESPEPYWSFAMHCFDSREWNMSVAGIDAAALSKTIAGNAPVEFSFVVDGKVGGHALGGYFPTLAYNEMFGEWEYSVPISLDIIRSFDDVATLAIKGTGVDRELPTDGLNQAVDKFIAICAPLRPAPG